MTAPAGWRAAFGRPATVWQAQPGTLRPHCTVPGIGR